LCFENEQRKKDLIPENLSSYLPEQTKQLTGLFPYGGLLPSHLAQVIDDRAVPAKIPKHMWQELQPHIQEHYKNIKKNITTLHGSFSKKSSLLAEMLEDINSCELGGNDKKLANEIVKNCVNIFLKNLKEQAQNLGVGLDPERPSTPPATRDL